MAEYRLSVNTISRGKGQSCVAAAAYRAGVDLQNERYGTAARFSDRYGVELSEIIAPDQTPDWMLDRGQLWNAVEAVEKRKDAQLAREIQLSLPHELTAEQRRDLVRGFVQEQFVNRGMIADIAIHAPSRDGDERNHHAHVMLTMREITAEGFGKKDRSWNDKALLQNWREQWAHEQNRELERHGHESRVDHRSFADRGIDREPTQHLGAVASDMERKGKKSRIGEQNRQITNDNSDRAANHQKAVIITLETERERTDLAAWTERKRQEIRDAQELKKLDLSQKHDRQKSRLESQLEERYGTAKATIKMEVAVLDRRLEAKGARKILRTVFGREKTDRQTREEMKLTLKNIEQREKEERGKLERQQSLELKKQAERQQYRRDKFDRSAALFKARQKSQSRKPTERPATPERSTTAIPSPTTAKPSPAPSNREKTPHKIRVTFSQVKPPEAKPLDEPSLAEKKQTTETKLDRMKGDLEKPWRRSTLSNDNDKPWRRSDSPRRERTPSPSPSGGGKGDRGGKT